MTDQLINRYALMSGMILGRRSPGLLSKAIILRTAGIGALAKGTAWSHDGILIQHNRQWYVGDAEMGHKARLTPLEDWERDLLAGSKAIILWPTGAAPEDGQAAAWYWQTHCYGATYDVLAVWMIAWRWLAEKFRHKVGREEDYYCTESCDAAWNSGTTFRPSPWAPKVNPTPGTTHKRTLAGRFKVIAAFTEAGKQYEIRL